VFRIQLTDVHSIVHECIVCRVSIFYSKYKWQKTFFTLSCQPISQ
jgi:hypothetical protein